MCVQKGKRCYNYRYSSKNIYGACQQGFYNYKFVVLDSYGNLNEGAISGNHWQTENNYKVIVYYRPLGGRYDQVIGYGGANSSFITN